MQIWKRLRSPFKVASRGKSDSCGYYDLERQVLHEVKEDRTKIPFPKIAAPTQHADVPYKLPARTEMWNEYNKLRKQLEV